MTYTDLVALTKTEMTNDPVSGAITNHNNDMLEWVKGQMVPDKGEIQNALATGDIFAVGRAKRTALAETCPGMPETQEAFSFLAQLFNDKASELMQNLDL